MTGNLYHFQLWKEDLLRVALEPLASQTPSPGTTSCEFPCGIVCCCVRRASLHTQAGFPAWGHGLQHFKPVTFSFDLE